MHFENIFTLCMDDIDAHILKHLGLEQEVYLYTEQYSELMTSLNNFIKAAKHGTLNYEWY